MSVIEISEKNIHKLWVHKLWVLVIISVAASIVIWKPDFQLADDYRLLEMKQWEALVKYREIFFDSNRIIVAVLFDQWFVGLISRTPIAYYIYNAVVFTVGAYGYWLLGKTQKNTTLLFLLIAAILSVSWIDVFFRISPVEKYYFLLTGYLLYYFEKPGNSERDSNLPFAVLAIMYVFVKELGFIFLLVLAFVRLGERGKSTATFPLDVKTKILILAVVCFVVIAAVLYKSGNVSYSDYKSISNLKTLAKILVFESSRMFLLTPLLTISALSIYRCIKGEDGVGKNCSQLMYILIGSAVYLIIHVVLGVGLEPRYILPPALFIAYGVWKVLSLGVRFSKVELVIIFILLANSVMGAFAYAATIKQESLAYTRLLSQLNRSIPGKCATVALPGVDRGYGVEYYLSIKSYMKQLYGKKIIFKSYDDVENKKLFEAGKRMITEGAYLSSSVDVVAEGDYFLINNSAHTAKKAAVDKILAKRYRIEWLFVDESEYAIPLPFINSMLHNTSNYIMSRRKEYTPLWYDTRLSGWSIGQVRREGAM